MGLKLGTTKLFAEKSNLKQLDRREQLGGS